MDVTTVSKYTINEKKKKKINNIITKIKKRKKFIIMK